ncbi:MAG TPA: hypothetical protein PKA05_10140 [Roseiflexaceae bacterium]|nr:hypothetical protein [Roseiflexaceae bacterium]HMP40727.1 hypothetical protein [Roseiflexaceae bacterium]
MQSIIQRIKQSARRLGITDAGPLVILVLFLLLLPLATPRIYATDEVQYYVYLRSLRFDGDLNFENDYRRFAELNPRSGIEGSLLQPDRIRQATGLYGNIAPVGSAIMWAPFFLLADLGVHLARAVGVGVEADGYSTPYILAVCYASALYGLFGLLLSYRLVRQYTGVFAATLAVVTIWLATPLVFYMYVQMPFAHATGFFLTTLFLTIWHATRSRRSLRAWGALGLVGALMTITREQLGLFLLIPALEALREYWLLLRNRPRLPPIRALFGHHLLFLSLFVIGLLPQLAAYQILNGEPRPAGEVSGKLNFCSPHFIDTLIDYDPRPSNWCVPAEEAVARTPAWSRGAFLWSPVLLPALVGLAWLWRRDAGLAGALLLGFLAQTYINGAFGTTWHLTGAFGFRRLIECTPIFVVGLALLIERSGLRFGRGVPLVVALLLIGWNAGLVLNATIFNGETGLRRGLSWPDLFRWQIEAPLKAAGKIGEILFDRCRFLENARCE